MAGIEQQYVKLLQQGAKYSALTSYVCVLCGHRIANAGKRDFMNHVETAHSDDPNINKVDLEAKSRAPGFVVLFASLATTQADFEAQKFQHGRRRRGFMPWKRSDRTRDARFDS